MEKGRRKKHVSRWKGVENCREKGGKSEKDVGGPQARSPPSFCFFIVKDGQSGLPKCTSGKELACQCRRHKRRTCYTWVGKIPWRRACQPTAVFLPGESHGQRSHGVAKSWTWLKQLSTHARTHGQSILQRERHAAALKSCKRRRGWHFFWSHLSALITHW